MAFTIPAMPLSVKIWHAWTATVTVYAAPNVTTVGNLSPGKRIMSYGGMTNQPTKSQIPMELLLPKLTDIRAGWNGAAPDMVEVPAGSRRFYYVWWVDDVAKGFANEYRIAQIGYSCSGLVWQGPLPIAVPVPMP
jgi:hypothetical protein